MAPAAVSAEDELQVALIGVGYQGRELLNAVRQIPRIRVCARVRHLGRRLRLYGQNYLTRLGQEVTIYTDFQDMLAKESGLAAVLIATPDFCTWRASGCLPGEGPARLL